MIKLILNLILLVFLIIVVLYFLPRNFKIQQLERLADIVQTTIKNKAEEFLLTPAEEREKIIGKIETTLTELTASSTETTTQKIKEIEQELTDLKAKNGELSFIEIIKTKLVEQFLKPNSATSSPALP